MALPAGSNIIGGRVVSVNPKGVKIEGQEGWLNFSKFATDIVPPERGQQVSLTLDAQGFVRAIETSGAVPTRQLGPGRDATISRLAVLKAAAEFGASRSELKSGDVLLIAKSWLSWVEEE